MDPGDTHLFVKRSANALTIAEHTVAGEFIKVSSLKESPRGDHIVVDAVNSSIVNTYLDPSWTVQYKNIARCNITRNFKEPGIIKKMYRRLFKKPEAKPHAEVKMVSDTDDAEFLALSYASVVGDEIPAYGLVSFRKLNDRVREFMQHLLDAHQVGVTHNDMHLCNVMLDKGGDVLRLIDYGRMCFSGLENPYANNPHIERIVKVAGKSASTRVKKHGKWSPFLTDQTCSWSAYYWMTDIVTLSNQLYFTIKSSDNYSTTPAFQRLCVMPFIKQMINAKGEEYDVADYSDADDLLELVQKVRPAMYTLLPGMVIYAIILKHIRDDGDEIDNRDFNYVYGNYVVRNFGGSVLLDLFNEEYGHGFGDYDDVMEYAFNKAGLYIDGQYGSKQTGGFGGISNPEYALTDSEQRELDEMESMEMKVPFPRDLAEAASWNDRLAGTRFGSVIDGERVQGVADETADRVPPAINFVDRPLVAPVSGGGRKQSGWVAPLLVTITIAMAFL